MNDYDIRTRTKDEARVPLAQLIRSHELNQGGVVLQQDGVVVKCVPSDDPEITDEMWTAAVRQGGYKGPIILGKDLLEI